MGKREVLSSPKLLLASFSVRRYDDTILGKTCEGSILNLFCFWSVVSCNGPRHC